MNQDVKPLTAVLLFALFAVLLGGKFWANGEAKAVREFSFMHEHPSNGSAYLLLDKQLFGFDAEGKPTGQIDLARFDVDENLVTDFAFFSNGDLLLRRHVARHDFVYSLQRYFRFTNLQDKLAEDRRLGLFRCDPASYACRPFSTAALNLNDAFGLAVDWHGDRVFISDSSRHTLYLYSADGTELDSAEGFLFPNQIRYRDGKLYIADTNHHQLAVLEVEANRFGKKLEAMDTRAGSAIANGEVWPSAFVLLDGRRWVLNAKNGMGYGGIYVFDDQGHYQKRLSLPAGADPMSLQQLGDSVLVSDYSQGKVYRFDLQGEPLTDFQPPVMQALLKTLDGRRAGYQNLSRWFTGLFVAALVGGFAAAIYRQRKTAGGEILPETAVAAPCDLDDAAIYWIKPRLRFKFAVAIGVVFVLTIVFIIPFAFWLLDLPWHASPRSGLLHYLAAPFFVAVMLLQLRRKIGIAEDYLVVVPPLGRPAVCRKDSLVYSDKFVLAGRSCFNLAQLSKMFTEDDVEQRLYPLIKQGRRIGEPEMRALILGQKKVLWFLAALIAVLVTIFLYFNAKSV